VKDFVAIFLDIDGVLNDHVPHANGYLGTRAHCVEHFNKILMYVSKAKIVVSSAWRYAVLNHEMNIEGFEFLLMTHGVDCKDRVVGTTGEDGQHGWITEQAGYDDRARLIEKYVMKHEIMKYVVLDDMPLPLGALVQTDPSIGLTAENADRAIEILTGVRP